MTTFYLRHTHAPCGEMLKRFDTKEHQAGILFSKTGGGFIVHMLSSEKPMTFSQLVDEVHKYNKDFDEELMASAAIAYDLCMSLQYGFAKAVSI